MKRVLIAAALGGLLLVGTPTLASSAQRNDTKAEKGDADKGGDRGGRDSKGGDNKSGDRGGRGDRENGGDHRGNSGDRRGERDGHRYNDRYYYGYPGYGGYYGDGYDCYYGRHGAYNCEPYGGDYGSGYGYGGSYRGQDGTVYVRDHAFNPPEIRIRPGDDATWIFNDRDPHTVTADNNSFDSGKRKDGEFRLTFGDPGSYSYHCAIHPDMKGRVIVG
jgi:copper binding plastocyanin/azurin family protein